MLALRAARAPEATTPPLRSPVAGSVRTSLHAVRQSYSSLAAETAVTMGIVVRCELPIIDYAQRLVKGRFKRRVLGEREMVDFISGNVERTSSLGTCVPNTQMSIYIMAQGS